MQIQFIPVSNDNSQVACGLCVSNHQRNMIETVDECLKEADETACWRPILLKADDEVVGFAMYGLWTGEGRSGRVWLDRFLIDKKHQGKGYAKLILPQLIEKINREYNKDNLYLSVYLNNVVAIKLYQKLGFKFNGERDINRELVMVRKRKSSE